MKIKHFIATFALAGVMALGVGAAFGVHSETNTVSASTGDANSDIYLNLSDSQCTWKNDSARFFFICKDSYGNDGNWYEFTQTITPLGTTDSLYHVSIPVSYAKFTVVRRNPDHTDTWGYIDTYTSSEVASQNVIKVYNYGSDKYTYSALDSSNYNIYSFSASASHGTALVSQKNGSENQTSGYVYAHMEFKVTGTPSSEYYFTGWSVTGTTTALDSTSTSNQTYKFKATSNVTFVGNYASARADAIAFAQTFNSNFESICDSTKNNPVGIVAPKSISDEWTNQKNLYAVHSSNADFVNILKNATSSTSNADLSAFALKYDYIFSKYSDLLNFANRTVVSPFASSKPISTLIGDSEINTSATAIVIAVTVISLTTIGGYIYLRKRKEN